MYPFVLDKYGMVAVYPFQWAGMEHQTMTTAHRFWVLNGSETGISHELAHMWWGYIVTCQDWRNIWLNEGFATYSDALYYEYRHGRTAFLSLMQERGQDYFEEDQTNRFPLYNPSLSNLFAWGTIYCKGSWIQHILRYLTGDTTDTPGIFFQALRTYGDSFRYSTANTEDYRRIQEQITGLDLTRFFAEWLYQAGYPDYRVNWACESISGNWRLTLELSQNNGANAPTIFHLPIQILVHLTNFDTLLTIPIDTNPQRNCFVFPLPVRRISFDPNSWILKKVTIVAGVKEVSQSELLNTIQVLPNPFHSQVKFLTKNAAVGKIEIYDVAGKLVRTLTPKPKSPLASILVWDGKDETKKSVPAGIYLAKIVTLLSRQSPLKTYTVKLLLLKISKD